MGDRSPVTILPTPRHHPFMHNNEVLEALEKLIAYERWFVAMVDPKTAMTFLGALDALGTVLGRDAFTSKPASTAMRLFHVEVIVTITHGLHLRFYSPNPSFFPSLQQLRKSL